jgi:D-3-phosphoglycerate dehydrogenase
LSRRMRVVRFFADRHPAGLHELIRARLPDTFEVREVSYSSSAQAQVEAVEWAEVMLLTPARTLAPEVVAAGRHLRLVQVWSSGVDKFNWRDFAGLGVPVANNGGANADTVAEHTVMLMLTTLRNLPNQLRLTETGDWRGNMHGLDSRTLRGRRVGLLGFGAIGRRVGILAHAFGADCMFHDTDPTIDGSGVARRVDPDQLLLESEVLSLHLHLDASTRGIIDAGAISRMPSGAVLINVSRAELVDQRALASALDEGHLSAAGVDVFTVEPNDPADPIVLHPRSVATPHYAASVDGFQAMMTACIENIVRVMVGDPPLHLVTESR